MSGSPEPRLKARYANEVVPKLKQEFGMTPLEYLLRTRFDVVCTMLSSTNIPVGKIARRCGMGDGNRLGRLFKERYGMSPTEFRAQRHVSL